MTTTKLELADSRLSGILTAYSNIYKYICNNYKKRVFVSSAVNIRLRKEEEEEEKKRIKKNSKQNLI